MTFEMKLQEAEDRGDKRGDIRATIRTGIELNVDDSMIIQSLMKNHGMSEEDAREHINEYRSTMN